MSTIDFFSMLLLLPAITAHGVLSNPTTRPAAGMRGTGMKLQPFAQARQLSASGCGGTSNRDPGVQQPTQAFASGGTIPITWDITIPHPADNLNAGVRIAIHYGPGDSFEQNILAGGVLGAGNPGTVSAALEGGTVTLPPGKTCNFCTLQWIWSADNDGGSYIGCADISITANGALPNFAALPSQAGNVLPGVRAANSGPGAIVNAPSAPGGPIVPGAPGNNRGSISGSASGGGGGGTSGGAIAGAVIGTLAGVALVIACLYQYNKADNEGHKTSTPVKFTTPPPPPPMAAPGQPALPPGWSSAVDPASGVTYYLNAATMASQWDRPAHV